MKLSQLFKNCAYDVVYETIGHDVNYAFVEDGSTLYIYFQGSASTTDWIRNFLFPAVPYKDMKVEYKVHRGFLAAWKEVEDVIIKKVTKRQPFGQWKYSYDNIVIVGYSHGAALAGLCHECVWFWRPDLREHGLIGFGFESPRFYKGWKVKKELQERWEAFIVIRNKNDIVTHCPPLLFRFCHVGSMLKIGKNSSDKDYKFPKCVSAHLQDNVLRSLLDYEAE